MKYVQSIIHWLDVHEKHNLTSIYHLSSLITTQDATGTADRSKCMEACNGVDPSGDSVSYAGGIKIYHFPANFSFSCTLMLGEIAALWSGTLSQTSSWLRFSTALLSFTRS